MPGIIFHQEATIVSQPGFAGALKWRPPTPYALTVHPLALWLPLNLAGVGLLVK